MKDRGNRKTKRGTVVSTKMSKTAVVSVDLSYRHPLYQKVLIKKKKYYAHDEDAKNLVIGQEVTIIEARPMSKLKRWRVVRGEN